MRTAVVSWQVSGSSSLLSGYNEPETLLPQKSQLYRSGTQYVVPVRKTPSNCARTKNWAYSAFHRIRLLYSACVIRVPELALALPYACAVCTHGPPQPFGTFAVANTPEPLLPGTVSVQ